NVRFICNKMPTSIESYFKTSQECYLYEFPNLCNPARCWRHMTYNNKYWNQHMRDTSVTTKFTYYYHLDPYWSLKSIGILGLFGGLIYCAKKYICDRSYELDQICSDMKQSIT